MSLRTVSPTNEYQPPARPNRLILPLVALLLGLAAPPLLGETDPLERWYRESAHAEQYRGVREELSALLEDASEAEIPTALVMRLVREGAVKRAGPEELVRATERYIDRLAVIRDALAQAGWWEDVKEDPTDLLQAGAAFLETSANAETARALIGKAPSPRHAREALLTLSSIYSVDSLEDPVLRELGIAFLESALSPGSYSSIASLYVQTRAGGRSASTVIDTIVATLSEGGGILQLRRELGSGTR